MAHHQRQKNQSPVPMALPLSSSPSFSKTCGQQGNECISSPFYPLPLDTSITDVVAASNPDGDAQNAPQANARTGGGKPAKQRPVGLRKRRCRLSVISILACVSRVFPF